MQDGLALTALPDAKKELVKFPRSYIINVIYTLLDDEFEDWTRAQREERNAKVVKDKNI